MRVLTGGMLFYSLLVWGIKLESFLGQSGFNNAGIVPSLQGESASFSFWWYVPDEWLWPVHIACLSVAFSFFIGFATRYTGVLSWLIAISYANRTMLANYGLDQILCLGMMYLMLAPCGRQLSLDCLIRRWWRADHSNKRSIMANVATRLMQVHLCVIYLFAGLSKLQGSTWWNGDAIWNVLVNYEYQSVDLTFLAGWRSFTDVVAPGTVLWEISFCALVWNRYFRPVVLSIGLAMHLGIGAFLGMWTFGLMMSFCYLGFVPARLIRSGINRLYVSTRRPDWNIKHLSQFGELEPEFSIEEDEARSEEMSDLVPLAASNHENGEPLILVLGSSPKVAAGLVSYFKKYSANTCFIDNVQVAVPLVQATEAVFLVFAAAPNSLAKLRAQIGLVLQESPQCKFVVSTSQVGDLPNSEFIPQTSTLREIRKAIELQLGSELSVRKEIPISQEAQTKRNSARAQSISQQLTTN